MKLCTDCVHFKNPLFIELEEKRQKRMDSRWLPGFDPPLQYPSSFYHYRCNRLKSMVTGEPLGIDAMLCRTDKKDCGPSAKFFEAKP